MLQHHWKVENSGLQPGVPGLHLDSFKEITGKNDEDCELHPNDD